MCGIPARNGGIQRHPPDNPNPTPEVRILPAPEATVAADPPQLGGTTSKRTGRHWQLIDRDWKWFGKETSRERRLRHQRFRARNAWKHRRAQPAPRGRGRPRSSHRSGNDGSSSRRRPAQDSTGNASARRRAPRRRRPAPTVSGPLHNPRPNDRKRDRRGGKKEQAGAPTNQASAPPPAAPMEVVEETARAQHAWNEAVAEEED